MKYYGIAIILLLWGLRTDAVQGSTTDEQAVERIVLNHATIVTDPGQPSYVQFAAEELAGYLQETTGSKVPIAYSLDDASRVCIIAGSKTLDRAFPEYSRGLTLSDEGYVLKSASRSGVNSLIASGRTPQGTSAALKALLKAIRVERGTAFVAAPLDVVGKPMFALRGMHFNGWPLNYPYSFRSWREQDWRNYLDILSYQGINLFYLWPFMEIMPLPLSPEDRAYLEECRRIVDYAQKKLGMEVWLMQCTNRVAKDRCGVADPRLRPYWRPAQEDLHPGKPADFQAILASREAMYRILNNVDGVCNIDSDPGFCPGSSFDDYARVLQACRAALDRCNLHGKQCKLVNWMLWGWGRSGIQVEGLVPHQLRALRSLKQSLREPFWLISGQFPEYLPMCRQEGLIARTVSLPYGVIEGEPAYPRTNVQIDAIRNTFSGPTVCADLAGFMGNLQTPLLQFPNLFFFTSVLSDPDYRNRSEQEVLQDLSRHLYPDHRRLLTDCFLALKETEPAKIETLAGRLDDVLQRDAFGRLGIFGRKLFPDHRIVARSLALQLRLRAAHERLMRGATPTAPRQECVRLLCDYLDAYLSWDLAHGWHELWGWKSSPLGEDRPSPALVRKLHANLASEAGINACFDEVARRLSAKYAATIVQQGCVDPLRKAVLAMARSSPASPRK